MKKLLTVLMLSASFFTYAQTPNIEWQHSFGGTSLEQGSVVRPTTDGGYILTGISSSQNTGMVTGNHGGSDCWVIKLTSGGAVEWKKSYGGTGEDKGYDIRQTTDGGYILCGYTTSSDGDATGNGWHGSSDFWVVKLNDTGMIKWQKAYGGNSADIAYNIIQTLDGGYAAIGLEATTAVSGDIDGNHGSFDYWIVKIDTAGVLQWQKSMGGSSTEQAFSLVQTADSGYVLCGYSASSNGQVSVNQGSSDYWITKVDKVGTLVWEHSYGGSGSDRCFNISKTSDGGFIVGGASASTDGDVVGNHGGTNDYWVVKLDSVGLMQWSKCLGGSGDDFGRDIQQTPDGGYVMIGKTNSTDGDVSGVHGDYDYWLVKLSSTGSLIWQKTYGGTAGEAGPGSLVPFVQFSQLAGGKFIFIGSTFSTDGDVVGNTSTSASDDSYWVVKLYGCPSNSSMADTICHGTSRMFNGSALAASGIYYDTLVSSGGCDSIVALNLYVRPSQGLPVVTGTNGALTTGTSSAYQWLMNGAVVTGANAQNYTATVNGNYQVVATDAHGCTDTSAAFAVTGLSVQDISFVANVAVYPNPAKDQLTISCPFVLNELNVALYSIDGRVVFAKKYTSTNKVELPINKLSNGIYMLKLTDEKGLTTTRRVTKQ